jgi:hypothetical protein
MRRPPAADPAKPVETPKPADAPPPKPADAPPPKAGDQPPPKTEQKPADAPKPGDQTPEQKAAAEKEQARQRGPNGKFLAEPLLPADWKPKAPDGVKLDEALVTSFRAIMADPKLTPAERGQAVADLQFKARENEIRAITEDMQRRRHGDLETLKGDPKFGGAFFDQTRAKARYVLEAFEYGPEVSKIFVDYGIDCHPAITKFLAGIRGQFSEDDTSSRLTSPTPANGAKPMSQIDRQAATYQQRK